jgi:hypothetical protein
MKKAVLGLFLALAPTLALAGDTSVVGAKATKMGGSWRIDVTVRHDDAGWDHYANGWGVYTTDGQRLGYREVLHPHVNEQPFTRSLTGVKIPSGVTALVIRAKDNVHGEGKPYTLQLP